MEEYIKDTLIASPYPFWLTVLIFALVTGLVQYLVFYFKEKGKNLATKEDIAVITKEIESVKASYNESLERHKMKLQKEFESDRYIIELCQNIDKDLIILLAKCKSEIEKENNFLFPGKKFSTLPHILDLDNYLKQYESRYSNILYAKNIMGKCIEFSINDYNRKINDPVDYSKYLTNLEELRNQIIYFLNLLLPKLNSLIKAD
ncbi:hypothetical protein [Bacteroides sp.]|uniref:hypothetical protein n=1 Tax=Bacteroides sp. TaxID=29523 RepID=UPI002621FCE3|nr:hypothetical protein [Bacteroides sp.]MDD3038613.1 hypothetical protein [Bacteroides sp.]